MKESMKSEHIIIVNIGNLIKDAECYETTYKDKGKEKEKQGPKRHKPWHTQKITYLSRKVQTINTVAYCQDSNEKIVRKL